jgi:hypothetical protein
MFPPAAAGVALLDAEEAPEVPFAFVAVTVKVYPVPAANPPTDIGEVVPLTAGPLLDAVIVKKETAFPPVALAVKVTDAFNVPAVAVPIVGA